ncbi:MAG: hypothetical protein MJ189_04285 [Coriobacteriales bacterium]|nr:hypothetical protein [Coriobacteriales bacterium]
MITEKDYKEFVDKCKEQLAKYEDLSKIYVSANCNESYIPELKTDVSVLLKLYDRIMENKPTEQDIEFVGSLLLLCLEISSGKWHRLFFTSDYPITLYKIASLYLYCSDNQFWIPEKLNDLIALDDTELFLLAFQLTKNTFEFGKKFNRNFMSENNEYDDYIKKIDEQIERLENWYENHEA